VPEISKQLVILKRLTNHLAGMTEAGGYGYDMACRVFRGRTVVGAETSLPALTILEAAETPDGNPAGFERLARDSTMRLLVQGFVADDKVNPTDPAHALKAMVEKRLAEIMAERNGRPRFPAAYLLGGLIEGISFGTGACRPPQPNVSDKAFFWIPVNVRFVADAENPTMTVDDCENP